MKSWIAFFRGINVGGKNTLPMKALVGVLEDLGLSDVRTYIQSGNAVFRATKGSAEHWERAIGAAVEAHFGMSPRILVMDAAALAAAVAANPFPAAESDHKTLHLYFLADTPTSPDWAGLDGVKSASEAYALIGRVFYLHAPEGIGRSKLAARAERLLGVEATARNWRTVQAVLALV